MSSLKMDVSVATNYLNSFENQTTELANFINELTTINANLSNNSIWKGPLNTDYTSSLNEFITALDTSSKIITKTKNDLNNCINNDIQADLA